ncbi:UNVERIFIED_CONTAM: hypothetical protein K2H54_020786 [Gekko kuhli]
MCVSLAAEEVAEGKNAILLGMSQWNSNDLVEQIETIGKLEENQGKGETDPSNNDRAFTKRKWLDGCHREKYEVFD